MSDKIKLLPDSIANQIAAGEVVQRPASVVKELMENAVDSGADEIKLFIREGGTQMIQVIDNGSGMSVTDARMCWERHATSKISKADDLFRLRSFGFRGEALASIAAVAHVEMRTKRTEDEVGVLIRIEGSTVKEQSGVSTPNGTQVSVKHLFFNIPARRNFLKSVQVETRHIMDEFIRVSMARPEISFSFYNNDKEVYILPKCERKQRVTDLLGRKDKSDLLEVNENHDLVNVSGYIGRPELAKKTRGEQYLFVNNRFVKDAYLNHAITGAYEQMLPHDSYATYVLFMDMDPARIDINVHPTKTEIKFDDERSVYALVKAAVKKSLGSYMLIPETLLREDPNIFHPVFSNRVNSPDNYNASPNVKADKAYNPFDSDYGRVKKTANWEVLFSDAEKSEVTLTSGSGFKQNEFIEPSLQLNTEIVFNESCFQIRNTFIVTRYKDQLLVVDQRAAHERILYERYLNYMENHLAATQQLLFPRTVELSLQDFNLVCELEEEIKAIGFDVAHFGNNCMIINGVPADITKGSEREVFEGLIEKYKNNQGQLHESRKNAMARAMAQNAAVFRNKVLEPEEMQELIQELLSCNQAAVSPSGKSVFLSFSPEKLEDLLKL
ncbi:MAG: DNA mismatch repair endonuclease MutL [Bacteroidia bacterium]|nr:DNA mismatch repair endonuclease MutL [Bacteroidia bacterium]